MRSIITLIFVLFSCELIAQDRNHVQSIAIPIHEEFDNQFHTLVNNLNSHSSLTSNIVVPYNTGNAGKKKFRINPNPVINDALVYIFSDKRTVADLVVFDIN